MRRAARVLALALAAGLAAPAGAHDGVVHVTPEDAAAHAGGGASGGAGDGAASGAPAALPPALPFPVDITLAFDLTRHDGVRVTEADYAGRPMAIFFGYANCEAICSVAIPRMAEAVALLGDAGAAIAPVMITVDPERDTVAYLAEAMPRYHDRMEGLTGSEAQLARIREAFQVEVEKVFEDPAHGAIYAHGSFVYLFDGTGALRSVVPPVLGPERVAELMRRHLIDAPEGGALSPS